MSTTAPAMLTIAFDVGVFSSADAKSGDDLAQLRQRSLDEVEDALWFVGAESISQSILDDGRTLIIAGFHDIQAAEAAASGIPQLVARQPGLTWLVEEIVDDTWMDEWKAHARPIPISGRLIIWPSWIALDDAALDDAALDDAALDDAEGDTGDRSVVLLDPGRAFGSGAHPSTVLVLEEMVRLIRPGDRVLDLGCGSGVLAVAAIALGAADAVALDIDPVAIEVTMANATLNGVHDRVSAAVVSAAALPHVDVALANIGIVPLRERLTELEDAAAIVVLAGLLTHQAEELAGAARGQAVLSRVIDGWQAVTITR